jgi:hypothetical protein
MRQGDKAEYQSVSRKTLLSCEMKRSELVSKCLRVNSKSKCSICFSLSPAWSKGPDKLKHIEHSGLKIEVLVSVTRSAGGLPSFQIKLPRLPTLQTNSVAFAVICEWTTEVMLPTTQQTIY